MPAVGKVGAVHPERDPEVIPRVGGGAHILVDDAYPPTDEHYLTVRGVELSIVGPRLTVDVLSCLSAELLESVTHSLSPFSGLCDTGER